MTHFIIAYHISLVKAPTNYCHNDLLILDLKQLNKIMKLYYLHALKALLDSHGKIKIYNGISLELKSSYKEEGLSHVYGKTKLYFLQFQK